MNNEERWKQQSMCDGTRRIKLNDSGVGGWSGEVDRRMSEVGRLATSLPAAALFLCFKFWLRVIPKRCTSSTLCSYFGTCILNPGVD